MENLPKIRFGYASVNTTLRDDSILISRTARIATIEKLNSQSRKSGVQMLKSLFDRNLDDLLTILKWNLEHGIFLYRIGSEIAPHITNVLLISKSKCGNYENLLYKLDQFAIKLKNIGKFAKDHNMRLTMHPYLYSLGTPEKDAIREVRRALYFHALLMDSMELDQNSVIIVHGGGIYGNKFTTMQKWVKRFDKLPFKIKRRIAVENDEKLYSISDILTLSKSVKPYSEVPQKQPYKIPVVFDLHHYYLYNQTILRKKEDGELLLQQPNIGDILQFIINSWSNKIPKMHISDERVGAGFGSHDDYVKAIPRDILQIPEMFKISLDIMVEAKMKELATLKLMKKYKKYI